MNGIEIFANTILKEACRVQASDLHIVPRQKDVAVQLRIGKDLMTRQCIEKEFGEKLVSHFKFLASMDIGEKRKPQNGSLYLQIDGQEVYLRLSTLQQYIKKVSLFAFIYKHLFSPYHIFRYFQVRQQNYSRFYAIHRGYSYLLDRLDLGRRRQCMHY